jgi:hypothetical protein
MIRQRKLLAYSLCAAFGLIAASTANAAVCTAASAAGTWHFFAMQGTSPGIETKTQSVVVGPTLGSKANITVFSNTASYKNQTSRVIKCKIVVTNTGNFTDDPCTTYGVTPGSNKAASVSGKLTVTPACDFTGTINVAGDDEPVKIVGGHANGNNASGIATQGNNQVLYFTLIKN